MDNIITISSDSSAPNSPVTPKKEANNFLDDDKTIGYFPNAENNDREQELEIAANCASKIHSLSSSGDSDSEHSTRNTDDNLKYSSDDVCTSLVPQPCDMLLSAHIEQDIPKPKKSKVDKVAALESKELKKAQREQKKLEIAQNKALKQAFVDARRMRKPGECLKYINVMLDNQILMEPHGGGILSVLSEMSIQYTIQEQIVPLSISWVCESKSHSFDSEMKLQVNSAFEEANEVVLVWHWSKVAEEISNNQLIANVTSVVSLLPQKKITIFIYGTKEYFRSQKGQHGKYGKAETSHANKKQEKQLSIPKISKQELEMELAELQISYNCNYRFIDSPDHLGTTIAQYTKAIAERPFKLEKNRRSDEELEWFALGDSRDCVKVDKNGNGLARLWKQQLCQFNLATLATAEAIVSVYSSPRALIEAYNRCSSRKEAELLLQDIPIRRGAGPLATSQRIGPELSRQICICFTATDGDETLGRG